MATQFIPAGKKITLKTKVRGDIEEVTSVTFKLYSLRGKKKEELDTVTADVVDGIAEAQWEATGPDEAKEMSLTVCCDVEAGETKAQLEPIVVFFDHIKVVAKDAKNSSDPLPLALCKIEMEIDSRFSMFRDHPWWGKKSRVLRADENGEILFDNLPPGNAKLSWRAPFKLKKWTKKTGAEREAQVERKFIAKLLNPKAGTALQRQFVNLSPSPTDSSRGSDLLLRVGADPAFSASRAGDKVYLNVKCDPENSDRNDDPKPVVEEKELKKGKEIKLDKAIAEDGGFAEFRFNFGAAGGDKFTISVGGTDDCADLELQVETWRKVWIVPVRPSLSFPLEKNHLPEAIRAKSQKAFDAAYIELAFEPAITVNPDDDWYGYKLVICDPDTSETLGLARKTHYFHRTYSPPHPHYRKKFLAGDAPPDREPRFYLLLGHGIYSESNGYHATLEMEEPETDWFDVAVSLLPVDPAGEPIVKGSGLSRWEDTQGNSGEVTDAFIEVNQQERKLKVKLPTDEIGAPGNLASKENPIKLRLSLRSYGFMAGGAIPGCPDWLSICWRGDEVLAAAYTLLHEYGHAMEQAVGPAAMEKMPGLSLNHPHTYGMNTEHPKQHGHQGPHCNFGLTSGDAGKANYADLIREGIHGSCIMFGGIGPKTDYAKALQICEHCLPYFKAWKL